MSDEESAHDVALAALVENVRGLVERVVRSHADAARIEALNDQVQSLCESLDPHTREPGPSELPRVYHAREPARFLPRNLVTGHLNPLAPPVAVEVLDDHVVGRVTFTQPYEGPPGYVHGGMVASVLDQVLAFANLASGHFGFTAKLTVRYHRPTPLFREVRFEARHDRMDGKRSYVLGQVFDGDVLTADAEALFVAIDLERAKAYFPHTDDFGTR